MRERVFSFGPSNGIVGILSEPAAETQRANAPGGTYKGKLLLGQYGPSSFTRYSSAIPAALELARMLVLVLASKGWYSL